MASESQGLLLQVPSQPLTLSQSNSSLFHSRDSNVVNTQRKND